MSQIPFHPLRRRLLKTVASGALVYFSFGMPAVGLVGTPPGTPPLRKTSNAAFSPCCANEVQVAMSSFRHLLHDYHELENASRDLNTALQAVQAKTANTLDVTHKVLLDFLGAALGVAVSKNPGTLTVATCKAIVFGYG